MSALRLAGPLAAVIATSVLLFAWPGIGQVFGIADDWRWWRWAYKTIAALF
jgi:hypothetical protein